MKNTRLRLQLKRLGAKVMVGAMLMETIGPAFAAVSQVPALYITPPSTNVMFTLDDSGSMYSDAIPDLPNTRVAGLPDDANTFYQYPRGAYPNMWGSGSLFLRPSFYNQSNAFARYLRSSAGNPIYYDPKTTYLPWPTAANDQLLSLPAPVFKGTTTPTQVRIDIHNPFSTTSGYLLDIKKRVNVSGTPTPAAALDNPANNFWPATYFVYTGAAPLTLQQAVNGTLSTAFTKYEIKPSVTTYPRGSERTDCILVAGVCTYNEELQNFANWLQYYRNRRLMAKGGVAAALAKQGTNLRLGFATINSDVPVTATEGGVVRRGVADFTGAARAGFYNDLYPVAGNSSTNLRRVSDAIGQYFKKTGVGNPWAENPSSGSVGKEYTCRRSIHVLSTDGYWNGAPLTSLAGTASNDVFSGQTPPKGPPTGPTYTFTDTPPASADPLASRFGISPFADTVNTGEGSLADVVASYWKEDLRPDLNNDVPANSRDPAFWQHLSTYTIGLGVSGTGKVKRVSDSSVTVPPSEPGTSPYFPYIGKTWLETQELRDALIANREPMAWTFGNDEAPETGDDLIHSSMVGRGRYLSATNPKTLALGLTTVLAEAADNPGSLANVVTSSPQVSTTTDVYQATYNPDKWYGRLYSFDQSASGVVNTKPSDANWEASNKMPAPGSRNIYTWNPATSSGTPFAYSNLTATQKANLGNDTTLVDYLRGSDAKEVAKGGPFRDRARYAVGAVKGGVLGDIVNGSPIKGPSAGGGFERLPAGTPGQAAYATYRATGNTALDNMRDTLFTGANDGMLHAFDRNTGVERFAFVPNSVFSVPRSVTGTELKLKMLSDPGYTHRYTVDGPPQIGDAFIGPSAAASTWRTVLLGSTGAGARSVFAMDISNPDVATGFNQNKLLWEFSEANNTDMGYAINYPHVARMRDGTWVAIFGNGYDSTNGQAKLFILNLQTGAVVWERSIGAAGGNGLSQPNFTVNNKREVTTIYAGDLKGNLWKFDVDSDDKANWKVAFGSAPNYTPLFTGSITQPITVMPEITFHPSGGTLLSFGTGKLFEVEDTAATGNVPPNVNLDTQALYGIWDKPAQTTGFSGNAALVQRLMNTALAAATDSTISGTTSEKLGGGPGETITDWTIHRGWYMDLTPGPSGERVNVNPQQAKSTLLMVANRPDSDPCKSGGSSRLFALDPITGSAPGFGVFNANGDTKIDSADKGYNVKSFSSAVLSLPTLQTKKSVSDQVVTERVGTRGQTGERLGGVENKPPSSTDCAQWLLAGGSDTSIAGFDISLCAAGKPRISWRQLK